MTYVTYNLNKFSVDFITIITPNDCDGCNSFDIVCVCVSVSVTTLMAEWTDIQT